MGLSRFVVDVQSPGCPVCSFTEQHEDSFAVLTPLLSDPTEPPAGFQVAVDGDRDLQAELEEDLSAWAEEIRPLRQRDDGATFLVRGPGDDGATHVFPTVSKIAQGDPVFEPVIGREGWLTVPFLAACGEMDPAEVVQECQETLEAEGHEFRLVRYRDYDPERAADPDELLTDKQQEVVRVAYSMGYYETPRQCTLQELAEVFGVSKAAIHMRIRTAEERIVESFVAPES